MTSPRGGTIGDAFIAVHADTLPFDRELDRNLERAAKDSEEALNRTGTDFGDKITDSATKRIGKRGRDFGRSIENATRNVVVRVRSIFRFDRVRDAIRRRFRRDIGESLVEEVQDAFTRASRRGGPFTNLGQGLADAIGAGFNVSGRSPLIALLLPALAALVGLILAAVQAVNALVAVLFIIPGLLASIGLQVGVIVIAFQGMGKAIQGAFAAKNAKELREALKGLTPSAKSFVRELLKLRPLFQAIQRTVQERFFNQLGGVLTNIRRALGPSLIKGFGEVAAAAGRFFRDFGRLLASPMFVKFFNTLIPATVRWLDKLSGSLFGRRGFITSILTMATVLMPFMEKFGDIILRNLDRISGLLFQLASSPATQVWLDRMAATLQLVFDLLFKVGEFLFVFMRQLDAQGGQEIFRALLEALDLLMFFFASPVGAKAMEGLINLGIIGIKVTTGLIIAIALVLAALQKLAEWIKDSGVPGIITALQFLGSWINRIAVNIGLFFARIIGTLNNWAMNIRNFFRSVAEAVFGWAARMLIEIRKFIDRIKSIPGQVRSALASLPSLLINAGRALIQGLINGIEQKLGALRSVVQSVLNIIGNVLPGSPAKEGPFSGHGYTLFRGQRMMQDFIKGIQMEAPVLRRVSRDTMNNIVFGRGSIEMTFNGPAPSESQARTIGNAMGLGAANMIAARNTRLGVRTL